MILRNINWSYESVIIVLKNESIGKLAFLILVISLTSYHCKAQSLRLNEVVYEEWSAPDADGDFGFGWIELKNLESTTLQIGNFEIFYNEWSWSLPNLNIDSAAFLRVWLSGKNRRDNLNDLHSSFLLVKDRINTFKIYDSQSANFIDSVKIYNNPYWNESYSYSEAAGSWFNTKAITPLCTNGFPGIWKKVSTYSQFSPRDSAPNAALVYNDNFWILEGWVGGGGEEAAKSEVWRSTNGLDWKLVNPDGPYNPYSGYVVFNNKMWAFDGSAYNSDDGISWNKVADDLPFSTNIRVIEFNGQLLVLKNDLIYSSTNGIDWSLIVNNGPWGARDFPGFLTFKDKIWIFGGGLNYGTGNDFYYNDVWRSDDGITWDKVTDDAEWEGRLWFGSGVFDGKMWLLGGWSFHDQNDNYYGNKNDVWYTDDGIHWNSMSTSQMWEPRHAPLVWVDDEALYLSSGYLNNFGLFNDVWKLHPIEQHHQTVYYKKRNFPLYELNSWGLNPDGTGLHPEAFNFDFQKFVVHNSDSVHLYIDFLIDGYNSNFLINNNSRVTIEDSAIFVSDLVIENGSTLVMRNSKSPTILYSDETSKVIVDSSSKFFDLDADTINNLQLLNGNVTLLKPTIIRNKLEINEGKFSSMSETINYTDNASIAVTTSNKYTLSAVASGGTGPRTLVASGDIVEIVRDLQVDSLVILSGTVNIQYGTLSVKTILKSETSSIETTEGYLKIISQSDKVFYPIGTKGIVAPIMITSAVDRNFSVRCIRNDTLRNKWKAAKIAWELLSDKNDGSEYTLTVKLDSSAIGFLDISYAGLSKVQESGWESSDIVFSNSFDLDIENRVVSRVLTETGMFSAIDYRNEIENDELVIQLFPNPTTKELNLLFIQLPSYSVSIFIYDLNGRVFFRKENIDVTQNEMSINLDSMPNGLYVLKAVNGDNLKSMLFSVKK